MESDLGPGERLRIAERAAAAPYVDYPPTPWWYPPFLGAYFAVVVSLWSVRGVDGPVRFVLLGLMLVMVALLGAIIGWMRRRRGTWPTGRAPREISRLMWWWLAGAVVVGCGVAVGLWLAPGWWLAVATGVVVWLGSLWYEHAYARAAARVRERLA